MAIRLSLCSSVFICGITAVSVSGLMGVVTPAAQNSRPRQDTIKSPDGHVAFDLEITSDGAIRYRVTRDGIPALDWSAAGIVVDGANLSLDAMVAEIGAHTATNRDYPTRGVHAVAHDRSNNAIVYLQDATTHTRYTMEIRVFDDGAGFRFVVPPSPLRGFGGTGPEEGRRTPDEATTFHLPPASVTWSHDLHGHYEAMYVKRPIEDVPSGDWAAPPLTYKLPGAGGYASITEAALTNYAGLALQADGRGGYAARLGHAHPVSYPYALRYKAEDVLRLAQPAAVSGQIQTPWRVILVSKDLNGLVNNDVIHNLAPPPDPALFPQGQATSWIKPGRAVWRYLDGGDNTYEGLKGFTDLAARLGFEHHVVEGVWRQWTPAQLRAFVDYATERHVGIWLWKHSRDLQTPEARKAFFDLCRDNGVVGAKIDFFDHEAKETIDLYDAILREAAEHHVMVDFHGANKPTGMDRTWPNELTREAIYGFEHRGNPQWGTHDTTVPFTRFLAGSADFTPTVFGDRRKETSWTHQVATAVLFTSTLLVYGGHPQSLLDSPAVEILRNVPSTWDETIALPPSEIGEAAVMARRSGRDWFVAAANGATARTVRVTPSFLGTGTYDATIARDDASNPAAMKIERRPITARDPLTFDLRPGGGFAARLAGVPARATGASEGAPYGERR
jgi:alpha-glucosidase